jgi:o-succinylbenzoate synthase
VVIHSSLLHRLDAVKLYTFELPLHSGAHRKGLLLSDGEGKWGEISPLPGRSKESFAQAKEQLLKLLHTQTIDEPLFPSVQFGLDSLLSSPSYPLSAHTYALLSGTQAQILQQADTAAKQGYTTVKIKIAPFSPKISQNLFHLLKNRFHLRVDCNSAFSFDEALALFSPFEKGFFEYIEDPTYEMDRLTHFPHPFALDETAHQYQALPLPTYTNLWGFILKPTVLGGKQGCTPFIEYAKKHHLNITLSSSFESGLGLLQIAALSKELGLSHTLLGIDTHKSLKEDLLLPGCNFNTQELHIPRAPELNLKLLTQVSP